MGLDPELHKKGGKAVIHQPSSLSDDKEGLLSSLPLSLPPFLLLPFKHQSWQECIFSMHDVASSTQLANVK